MIDREALKEMVWDALIAAGNSHSAQADAAIDLLMEEAARVAEREGVYPELNVAHGGPEWYRHGKNIAAAIRALTKKETA